MISGAVGGKATHPGSFPGDYEQMGFTSSIPAGIEEREIANSLIEPRPYSAKLPKCGLLGGLLNSNKYHSRRPSSESARVHSISRVIVTAKS